jgi:hypothetical protein
MGAPQGAWSSPDIPYFHILGDTVKHSLTGEKHWNYSAGLGV